MQSNNNFLFRKRKRHWVTTVNWETKLIVNGPCEFHITHGDNGRNQPLKVSFELDENVKVEKMIK